MQERLSGLGYIPRGGRGPADAGGVWRAADDAGGDGLAGGNGRRASHDGQRAREEAEERASGREHGNGGVVGGVLRRVGEALRN
jgi:hypothetical protein